MSANRKKKEKNTPPEVSGSEEYTRLADGVESRWFQVVGERFDWLFAPNKMKTFKNGQICYEPLACFRKGRDAGLVVAIERPANARVDKSGRVVFD